jgi:hypothetical protein
MLLVSRFSFRLFGRRGLVAGPDWSLGPIGRWVCVIALGTGRYRMTRNITFPGPQEALTRPWVEVQQARQGSAARHLRWRAPWPLMLPGRVWLSLPGTTEEIR